MKRKSISKSIRFEVFKRDRFTCQYCGEKAPDVVLHVDHIDPVSKGGDNGIVNLITSCFDCNLGKRDRKLNDNSVVEKQRKQLELIQERREQIELMFKWKKSLSNLDDETLKMIKEYVEAKIDPFTVSENGENNLRNHLRKYDVNEVLDAIDVAATTYLKFSNTEGLTRESVEKFLDKLGGVLFVRRLSPIDQKLMHIKNNAKNSLSYYDPRKASIILQEYVAVLRSYWNYSDDEIIKDFDSELIPNLSKAYNWTEWISLIESWIESIKRKSNDTDKAQENNQTAEEPPKEWTKTAREGILQGTQNDFEASIKALVYLLKPFPKFEENEFIKNLYKHSIGFLDVTARLSEETIKKHDDDNELRKDFIKKYIGEIIDPVTDDEDELAADGWFLMKLDEVAYFLIENSFGQFYSSHKRNTEKDVSLFRVELKKYLKKMLKEHNQGNEQSPNKKGKHEAPPF